MSSSPDKSNSTSIDQVCDIIAICYSNYIGIMNIKCTLGGGMDFKLQRNKVAALVHLEVLQSHDGETYGFKLVYGCLSLGLDRVSGY